MSNRTDPMLWPARLLILPVLGWNLQCGLLFLLKPHVYAAGFEVVGTPGQSLVQGLGLLFVMWSVPYVVALWHPLRQRVSLVEALAMQTIGLLGESWLLARLPSGHAALRATTWRFIWFDGIGALLLMLAVALTHHATRSRV